MIILAWKDKSGGNCGPPLPNLFSLSTLPNNFHRKIATAHPALSQVEAPVHQEVEVEGAEEREQRIPPQISREIPGLVFFARLESVCQVEENPENR